MKVENKSSENAATLEYSGATSVIRTAAVNK
jgi:hypothetical protein